MHIDELKDRLTNSNASEAASSMVTTLNINSTSIALFRQASSFSGIHNPSHHNFGSSEADSVADNCAV